MTPLDLGLATGSLAASVLFIAVGGRLWRRDLAVSVLCFVGAVVGLGLGAYEVGVLVGV